MKKTVVGFFVWSKRSGRQKKSRVRVLLSYADLSEETRSQYAFKIRSSKFYGNSEMA
jgi:hypothetical protein